MKRLTPDLCAETAQQFNRRGACPAPFTMRVAVLEDLEDILAVGKACFSYNAPVRTEIRHMLTTGHGAIALLCDGAAIAGYILVEAHAGRESIYFNTAALLPAYRGRGMGKVLYAFVDALAAAVSAKSLWCHVAVNNDVSMHLFVKDGYAVERTEEEYYDDGRAAYVLRKAVGQ